MRYRIVEIILHNYKRLKLNNISTFTYRPKDNINVILGRNGSGKTSIFRELSPLPADMSDYFKGGFKVIRISYRGNRYELKSTYDKKHSFICNNEELNPGGTKTAQLMLVEEHFNYNKTIHDYITGIKLFTDSTTNERKQIINLVSKVDFTLALFIFDKLKKLIKENDTILKYNIARLAKLREDDVNIGILNRELEVLKDLVNIINKEMKPVIKDPGQTNIMKLLSYNKVGTMVNEDELLKLEKIINETTYEIESVRKELKTNTNIKSDDLVKLKGTIEEKRKRLKLVVEIDPSEELFNTLKLRADVNYVLDKAETIDSDIYKHHIEYLKNEYKKLQTLLEEQNKKITILSSRIGSYKHIHNEDTVSCDVCGNKINILDNLDLRGLEIEKEELLSTVSKIEKELERISNIITEVDSKDQILIKLKELLSGIYKIELNSQPDILIIRNMLDKKVSELEFKKEQYRLSKELSDLERSYIEMESILKDFNQRHQNILREKLESLNEFLGIKRQEYVSKKKLLEDMKSYQDTIGKAHRELVDNIKHKRQVIYQSGLKELLHNVNDLYNDILKQKTIQEKLEEQKQELSIEIEKLNKRSLDIKNMITCISPTKGIIGDTVMSILNNLLADMNDRISELWSYPITILPCKIDKTDLDYKFPVIIDNEDSNPISDIKLLSSGTKEVVNHVFKLVILEWLGLEDFPIFLDEFGRAMDVKHRYMAYEIIDKMFTQGSRQIFMVSHFEEQYARLGVKDSTFILLDNETKLNVEYNDKEVVSMV